MNQFDLVIFDCDGVLVDSERLAVRTEVRILERLGWPLTESEVIDRFVGRSAQYMQSEIERKIGRAVNWGVEFEPWYRQAYESELEPVVGIEDALDRIELPVCVASSGSHEKMAFTLGLTGLFDRFAGKIFSVDEVEHGKPAPDIFLHAAERMGADPVRCAVVEDSASGVSAGVAAGMTVFGFAGGVTAAKKLTREGVSVFSHMTVLPDLLA